MGGFVSVSVSVSSHFYLSVSVLSHICLSVSLLSHFCMSVSVLSHFCMSVSLLVCRHTVSEANILCAKRASPPHGLDFSRARRALKI